jgi:hypothetical protein
MDQETEVQHKARDSKDHTDEDHAPAGGIHLSIFDLFEMVKSFAQRDEANNTDQPGSNSQKQD